MLRQSCFKAACVQTTFYIYNIEKRKTSKASKFVQHYFTHLSTDTHKKDLLIMDSRNIQAKVLHQT